ncbi:hypothetical protein [Streptomyces sp. NPDC050738]|uniref:hypothetical protein n=1 Tax=Streptomyces sp. NPDC050738 TaxID=3154744 RepID=UPI00342A7E12
MVTRILLLGIFVTGLVAQFVKPIGDALQDKTFLGGALFSLVGYILYDAVKEISARDQVHAREVMESDDLGDQVAAAFSAREVTVCFFGYTGETLVSKMVSQLEQLVRNPGNTQSVTIRMMVPDFSQQMVVPARVGPDGTPQDDPVFRARLDGKCRRYRDDLQHVTDQLAALGRVRVEFGYRQYQGVPREKICIFNDQLVLHGRYNIATQQDYGSHAMYDPKGYMTDLYVWSRAQSESAVARWVKDLDNEWEFAVEPAWSNVPQS